MKEPRVKPLTRIANYKKNREDIKKKRKDKMEKIESLIKINKEDNKPFTNLMGWV